MKEHTLLFTAIRQLKVDVPVLRYEIEAADGDAPKAIRLYLYGGQVVTWLPEPRAPGETSGERHTKPPRRQTIKRADESTKERATQ